MSINFFDGAIVSNEIDILSMLTEKELWEAGRKEIVKVLYGENILSVFVDFRGIENNAMQVEIVTNSRGGDKTQKMEVNEVNDIYKEIQSAVYSMIKIAKWCPKAFCFHWLEAGDYAAPGMYSSLAEAGKQLKLVKKGQCGFSYGKCCRASYLKGEITDSPDFYEPCEPYLRKKGLPDLYFVKEKN